MHQSALVIVSSHVQQRHEVEAELQSKNESEKAAIDAIIEHKEQHSVLRAKLVDAENSYHAAQVHSCTIFCGQLRPPPVIALTKMVSGASNNTLVENDCETWRDPRQVIGRRRGSYSNESDRAGRARHSATNS